MPKPIKKNSQKKGRRKRFTHTKNKAKIVFFQITDHVAPPKNSNEDELLKASQSSHFRAVTHQDSGESKRETGLSQRDAIDTSMAATPSHYVTVDDMNATGLSNVDFGFSHKDKEMVSQDPLEILQFDDYGGSEKDDEEIEPTQQIEGESMLAQPSEGQSVGEEYLQSTTSVMSTPSHYLSKAGGLVNEETEPAQYTARILVDLGAIGSPTMSLDSPTPVVSDSQGGIGILDQGSSPIFQSQHTGTENTYPPAEEAKLLEQARCYLLLLLPDCWVTVIRDAGIHIGLWARSKALLVQRSIFFSPDGTISVTVHGKELPERHKFWENVQKIVLQPDSVKEFAENIVQLAGHVRLHEICAGVQHYENLWKYADDCTIDKNDFHETKHTTTCRSNQCLLLVPSIKTRRCDECGKIERVLAKRSERRKKLGDDADVTPKKGTRDSVLNTPQTKKKMRRQSKKIKYVHETNHRLKEKIARLMKTDGVKISQDLSEDLVLLLESAEGLSDFQKLFIQQQLKAASVKRPCGMRWHPALIRLALSICSASPAAYEELSGILKLPSERQLFDYSHVITAEGSLKGSCISVHTNEVVEDFLLHAGHSVSNE